jgi:chromosome segregation protein
MSAEKKNLIGLIENKQETILSIEKENAILEKTIERENKLKNDLSGLETCPLCQNNITDEHRAHVSKRADEKISNSDKKNKENIETKEKLKKEIEIKKRKLTEIENNLSILEIEKIKLQQAEDKKTSLKSLSEKIKENNKELSLIHEQMQKLNPEFEKLKNIEEKYDEVKMELTDLRINDIDVDSEIGYKNREIERMQNLIKAKTRDIEESEQELKKIMQNLQEKNQVLEKLEKTEQEIFEKSQALFSERNELEDQQKAIETTIIGFEHEKRMRDERVNNFNIQKAQYNAQLEALSESIKEFEDIEPLGMPIEKVKSKLSESQLKISQYGNVNMAALDVFEKIQEQVQLIQDKVDTIVKEKEKIMKIIAEIDKKKKKTFLTTLDAVNEYFTKNFTQLSKKGEVFLELENKQEPFEAGINIILKVGRGKYFDISSLSGGEKTLVALSLLFAIQEYKPYAFYIFDEIDAALDKHNSELLAALLKKHMTHGQYIVISHNDALINEASTLYGVSMQENISKVISLKINE